MTTALVTPLTALTDDLDAAVRGAQPGQARVDAVGLALAPHLGDPRLLRPEQCVGDPARYRQHVLHVPPDGAFSLVALVWLPGQTTPIHDHLSWCVVGVHTGAEHEIRYRRAGEHLVVGGGGVAGAAGPRTPPGPLPPGDTPRATNTAPVTTISLHVYGVDVRRLGSSIRRR